MLMPVNADVVGLADRVARRRSTPAKKTKKPVKSSGSAAGSGLGALRLLLEASGRGDDTVASTERTTVRPQSAQSAPTVVGQRSSYSVTRQRPGSACTAGSRPRSGTWPCGPQHIAQYLSPLSVSGPLLRPRSAPSGSTRRERRLGLTLEADPDATSWQSLEASKVRVVAITDRLEYLKHLQDGLSHLSMKQAEEMSASYKSQSRMQDALKNAGSRIEQLLGTQRNAMKNGGTTARRFKEINRFLERQQEQRLGQAGAEAARASACSDPNTLMNVDDRFDFEVTSAASQARRSFREPTLAVVGMVPYAPPTGCPETERGRLRSGDVNVAENLASSESDQGRHKKPDECEHEISPVSEINDVPAISSEAIEEAPRPVRPEVDDSANDVG